MTGWRREIARASAGYSEPPCLLTAAVERTGAGAFNLAPPRAKTASTMLARIYRGRALLDRVPPSRRLLARIETGVMREGRRTRRWTMLLAAGFAAIGRQWSEVAPPWAGEAILPESADFLPVVLGPSAVLLLVAHLFDTAQAAGKRVRWPSGLSVRQSSASPYPPQDSTAVGADPGATMLLRASGAIGEGALYNHFRRNLTIDHGRAMPAPRGHLLVDALYPLRQLDAGVMPFLLHVDLVGEGRRLTVAAPLECAFAPATLLRAAVGAAGSPAPAVERDPIFGDAIGLAPPLATNLTVADLIAERRP